MKTLAREIVREHYHEQLNPTFDYGHNSGQVAKAVGDNVRDLLDSRVSPFHVGLQRDQKVATSFL